MEDNDVNSSRGTLNMNNSIENIVPIKMVSTMAQAFHSSADNPPAVSQKVYPPDKTDPGTDVLPGYDQAVTFSAGPRFQGHIRLSESGLGSRVAQRARSKDFIPVGQLLRPRSPTRQCSIPERDKSHFNLALMESKVGSEASEQVFHVQQHELICAISSQTSFVDNEGRIVSSIDISYYWCNFCTFSTATKTLLMQHVMEHRFHCKFCHYQSFSRADIIHHSIHMHPDFKKTVDTTRYCTLLSDYLRLQHPKEELLDHQRKRKHPSGDRDKNSEQPLHKVNRTDLSSDEQSVKHSADYMIFDVDVGDKEHIAEEAEEHKILQETGSKSSSPPSLKDVRKTESPQYLEYNCTSFSSVRHLDSTLHLPDSKKASDLSDQSAASHMPSSVPDAGQTSLESVFPPDLMPEVIPSSSFQLPPSCSSSYTFSCMSHSQTPSPPNLSSVGTVSMSQGLPRWTCGYCPFSSISHKSMKKHCNHRHRGKPFKCQSPDELDECSAPPLLRYDDRKTSNSIADQDCDIISMKEEITVNESVSVCVCVCVREKEKKQMYVCDRIEDQHLTDSYKQLLAESDFAD